MTLVSILGMIVVVFTLVLFACVTLPDWYCIVKDSVTEQLLLRCCRLEDNQHRQLLSAYSNLSLPTMSDTWFRRNFLRCIIYPKESVECLRLRSRYGANVLTLLEPWDSFTVYTRKHGPGSVICKHLVFSRETAFVILSTHAIFLVTFCYSVYSVLYVFTVLLRMPLRPHVDPIGRGGANDRSTSALTANDNARPAVA